MKTKLHGCGLTHKQVVLFSNRLASMQASYSERNSFVNDYEEGFYYGWSACAKYFAHELRVFLRDSERI